MTTNFLSPKEMLDMQRRRRRIMEVKQAASEIFAILMLALIFLFIGYIGWHVYRHINDNTYDPPRVVQD